MESDTGNPWEAMGSLRTLTFRHRDSVIAADPGNADVGKVAAGLHGCRWSRERGSGDDTSTRPKKKWPDQKRWKKTLETPLGNIWGIQPLERSLVQCG